MLCLQKDEIVPHLHFKQLNSHISFADAPFAIPTQPQSWPPNQHRLAGVSAFGFGGTNVHVILEAAPVADKVASVIERPQHLLTLSALSAPALSALAQRYQAYLETHPNASLADICFTANTGRSHFAHRLAISADSKEHLSEHLTAFAAKQRTAPDPTIPLHPPIPDLSAEKAEARFIASDPQHSQALSVRPNALDSYPRVGVRYVY